MSDRIGSGEGTDLFEERKDPVDEGRQESEHERDEFERVHQPAPEMDSNSKDEAERPFICSHVPPMSKAWLEVPKALTFFQSDLEGIFVAKIQIKNRSQWNMAYCVQSSSVEKFNIKRRTGWIRRNDQVEIMVMNKPGKIKDFGSLCLDQFVVIGVPVYFASQLQKKKIRLLWRAYGSPEFPFDTAEVHKIHTIIPAHDSYMDDYNIIGRAALGNYVATKRGMDIQIQSKTVDKATFYANWRPTESKEMTDLQLHYVFNEVKKSAKNLAEEMQSMMEACQTTASVFIILVVTAFMIHFCGGNFQYEQLFGPNGYFINPPAPVPESKSWWQYLTFQ